MRPRTDPAVPALLLVAALLPAIGGCSVRVLAPADRGDPTDRLHALEAETSRLKAENEELRIAVARAAPNADRGLDPEVLANAPFAVGLHGAFGSATPSPTEGGPIELIVQVEPVDSRNRFVQVTGWFDVSIVALGEDPAKAEVIATRTLSPRETREALRAGLFGISYGLACDVPAEAMVGRQTLIARVVFRDGFTTGRLETVVNCTPPRPLPVPDPLPTAPSDSPRR